MPHRSNMIERELATRHEDSDEGWGTTGRLRSGREGRIGGQKCVEMLLDAQANPNDGDFSGGSSVYRTFPRDGIVNAAWRKYSVFAHALHTCFAQRSPDTGIVFIGGILLVHYTCI